MSKERNNLLIAASGTGGHIFPALALASSVDKYWQIHWLGNKKRLDYKFVPKKYNLSSLNLNTPKSNIFIGLQYLKILFSTIHVLRILKEKKINLVFTTGGFISAPTILAAKLLKVPIVIHESNFIPGIVTKYFGSLCDNVLLGFQETKKYLRNCKTIFTSTPLRKEFYMKNPLPEWVPKGKGPLILIIGGSQGAKRINEIIYNSIDFLVNKKFRIVHITGESQYLYSESAKSKTYVKKKFTNQVAALMQNCDLVISRSGSGTINELMQTRKPSILIPYPNSKKNHQEKNAMILTSIGGSILINENKLSEKLFQKTLSRIFNLNGKNHYQVLDLMKNNMKKYNYLESSNKIEKLINYFLNDS